MSNEVAQAIAVASAGLFSGAALMVTAVDHPAWTKCGPAHTTTFFKNGFWGMAKFQGGLATVSTAAAAFSAYKSEDASDKRAWAIHAALMGLLLPYTKVSLMPLNNAILAEANKGNVATEAQFKLWGEKHAVRTVLGLAAFGTGLFVLLRK